MTYNCGDPNTKIKDGDVLRHVVDLKTKACMRCGQKFSLGKTMTEPLPPAKR